MKIFQLMYQAQHSGLGSDTSLILNHHQLPMLQSFFCRNVRFYRCTLGIKWSAAKSQKPGVQPPRNEEEGEEGNTEEIKNGGRTEKSFFPCFYFRLIFYFLCSVRVWASVGVRVVVWPCTALNRCYRERERVRNWDWGCVYLWYVCLGVYLGMCMGVRVNVWVRVSQTERKR